MPIGWRIDYWVGVITWGLIYAVPVRADSVPQQTPTNIILASPRCTASLDNCRLWEIPLDSPPLAQITAVNELAIEPTDAQLQALQSLVERYNILGFENRFFFNGDRALSRNEFALILAQVLDRVNTLIRERTAVQIEPEDLITLRRLQREYDAILQQLDTQLNALGDRTNELAANQFSTTTKLSGEAIIGITYGTNAQATVVSRQRLNLRTSFAANDLLLMQLEAGNAGQDAISLAHNQGQNLLGTSGLLADGGGLKYTEVDRNLRVQRLYYTFRAGADAVITIGAKMSPRDFIDRNQFANNPAVDFSSSFLINNPLIVQNQIDREGGAGAAIAWNINGGDFTLRLLYIAADGNQPNSSILTSGGLFNDRYQGSVELEYSPSANLAVRLQYTNAAINNTDIQAAGVNAEYAFNRNAAIFGRFGFGSYHDQFDLTPNTWAIGLSVRNLAIPGTIAGIAFGQPFVENNLGDATQTNFEAFYNLTLSDNISVTPAVQLVKYANNQRSNNTIWQGTLRTVFSF